jgi:hypothetical protein
MYVGKPAVVQVTASINGYLNAWMDFNKDGDWSDPGEQVFTNTMVLAGLNSLTFNIPSTALQGKTYMRYRFNTIGGVPSFGLATDGEVEDYQVHACPKWIPVPTPKKHTILIPNNILNMTQGDVLGVFYMAANGMEACAGVVEWDGTNTQVMIAYGDNPATPEKDGFIVGEPIIWRLCSYVKGDADPITVTYDPTYPNSNGLFVVNGFSSLGGIQGLHVAISATPNSVCAGEPVQLNAAVTEGASGVTFSWTSHPAGFFSGEQSPVVYPLVNTTYYLHSTDGVFNDYDTVKVTVTEFNTLVEILPLRNINVPSGVFRCYNATMKIQTAGNSSTFLVQNGAHVQLIAGQQINLLPGTRVFSGGNLKAKITLTGAFCCNGTPPLSQPVTGLFDEKPASDMFRVYPNPSQGIFTVELNGTEDSAPVRMEIYDMVGTRIAKMEIPAFRQHSIDLTGRPSGVYILHLFQGEKSSVRKIIKQ